MNRQWPDRFPLLLHDGEGSNDEQAGLRSATVPRHKFEGGDEDEGMFPYVKYKPELIWIFNVW